MTSEYSSCQYTAVSRCVTGWLNCVHPSDFQFNVDYGATRNTSVWKHSADARTYNIHMHAWIAPCAVLKVFLCIKLTCVLLSVTFQQSSNPVLRLYYTSRSFLFVMCFGNEAFYGAVYISHFWSGPGVHGYHLMPCIAAIFLPIAVLKTVISLLHLVIAAQTIVGLDHEMKKRLK